MALPGFKKISLIFFACILTMALHAQSNNWMLGTWNGNGNQVGNLKSQFSKTIVIDSVGSEGFSGTRTVEVNDRSHARIVTALQGSIDNNQVSLQNGAVLFKKDPPNGGWLDCSSCTPENKIFIKADSIILVSRISGCRQNCDATSTYYRLLCEYDSVTQKTLVVRFGTASDVANFKSCEEKKRDDSLKNILAKAEKRVTHNEDSIAAANKLHDKLLKDSLETAAAYLRKRRKESQDSTDAANALAKQHQREIDDSIAVAKKRQQQLQDSIAKANVIAKKKWQQTQDSINLSKQKEQQRINDSIANATALAKKRQQFIADSTNNAIALAKKRQQQVDDSLALVAQRRKQVEDSLTNVANVLKQQEQQRVKDSLANAAALAKKRQKEIDDSTNNAIAAAKKRQQFIDDSTNNAIALAKKRQQQINDSIALVKQREQQHIQDSISLANALQKKRQKEIDDSLALVRQKQQKHIQDSISNAELLAKQRRKFVEDSTRDALAAAKRRQQFVDDSLNIVRQKEQKRLQDSINNIALLAKQKQQHIDDSIARAKELAKNPPPPKDTAKPSTAKAFETRTNVLLQTYHITSPDILIELFDNAQVDGDRVSVYHNSELIVNNKMLDKTPITFKIHADANNRTHEFTMIAENLGTIPPNTALMRITVGTQIYKLGVKTDLQTNAKIVFVYDGN